MTGELHLIMGCMFSGKSTELIKIIRKYQLLKKTILPINHVIDTRYGNNKIITHNKTEIPCMQLDKLLPLLTQDIFRMSDVIVIEEAHFFEDLYPFVLYSINDLNKKVYVAGLNGDYKQEPIGDINKLIPHSDTITKLSALCTVCNDGTPAHFTKRIITDNTQILVGSTDSYIPVCRKHIN